MLSCCSKKSKNGQVIPSPAAELNPHSESSPLILPNARLIGRKTNHNNESMREEIKMSEIMGNQENVPHSHNKSENSK
jgi:hypothetical protein